MAQYDLVFIKNDASSGVSYNEFKLQKPPGAGYSLTQHPTSGVLSWVQSMNNGGAVSGNFNDYTETGYYIIPNSGSFTNEPKYIDGILQVFKTTSGVIYQTASVKPPTNPTNPTTFVRHFRPGSPGAWTSWAAVELIYEAPVRPPEDPRAPYSVDAEGSIAASLMAVENALMNHTYRHIFEDEVILDYREWNQYNSELWGMTVDYSGVHEGDVVHFFPTLDYVNDIIDAEILPVVDVLEGAFYFYAKSVPIRHITVKFQVFKKS